MSSKDDDRSSYANLTFSRWSAIPSHQALYQFDDHTLYFFSAREEMNLMIMDHLSTTGKIIRSKLPSKCEYYRGYGKSLYLICSGLSDSSNASSEISRKIFVATYNRETEHIAIDFVRQLSTGEAVHEQVLSREEEGSIFFYRFCDKPITGGIIVDTKSRSLDGAKMIDIHRNKLIYVATVNDESTLIEELSKNVILISTGPFLSYYSPSNDLPFWILYRGDKHITVFNLDKLSFSEEVPAMRFMQLGKSVYSSNYIFNFLAVEPLCKQCDCDGASERRKKRHRILDRYASTFLDNFRILKVLGEGGFGCVFEAINYGQRFAVKRIAIVARVHSRKTEGKVEIAMREVRVMEQLKHKHIVQYHKSWLEHPPASWQYAADEKILEEMEMSETTKMKKMEEWTNSQYKDGTRFLYIQMEICKYSLYEWLPKNEDRPLIRMLSWFRQIVSAVGFMHRRNFFHRDLKPSNILFADIDHLKICDLGLATEIKIQDGVEVSLSRTAIGTRLYWAPEQTFLRYSSKVDIFSLGLILIEMLDAMDEDQRECAFNNYRTGAIQEIVSNDPLLNEFIHRLANPDTPKDRPDYLEILQFLSNHFNITDITETADSETVEDDVQIEDINARMLLAESGGRCKIKSIRGSISWTKYVLGQGCGFDEWIIVAVGEMVQIYLRDSPEADIKSRLCLRAQADGQVKVEANQDSWKPFKNNDGSWKLLSRHGLWLSSVRTGMCSVKKCGETERFWISKCED